MQHDRFHGGSMSILALGGSSETLAKAFDEYQTAWKAFLVINNLEILEHQARPTALGWKVADKPALYADLAAISNMTTQVHIGTVNQRQIASAVLAEPYAGIPIIKILERRAGALDPLGLDHIDFLVDNPDQINEMLQAVGARIEHQHNHAHTWLSLRFGKNFEYEAKFVDHSVLDVCIKELQATRKSLGLQSKSK